MRQRCEAIITDLQSQRISVAQTRQLNQEFGEDLARLLLSSATLQTKAVVKLGEGLWWATEKALQQSTPCQVARLKASWFGDGPVYDLCCGLGGDARHLALNHDVVAIDKDPAVCLMAGENLTRHAPSAEVICSDVSQHEIPSQAWVHFDPDRRAANRRSTDPDFYAPPWEVVSRLVADVRGGCIKLAPAAEDVSLSRNDTHRVWISLGGEVREQTLLLGETVDRFRDAGQVVFDGDPRSAIAVKRDQQAAYFSPTDSLQGTVDAATATKPSGWMVDPDAAIRSAGLTQSFANQFGLQTLGGLSGFLTGDVAPTTLSGLAIYEQIIWHGPCDDRKLRKELRARDCYPWRVKTRGVSQDPNVLEKKLRPCGEQACTLWIGKNGKRQYAVLTQ